MSLIVNGITPVNIFIDDCLVEGNYATVFGAGIYILLDGLSNHIIDITGCNILDNSTPGSAGGMEIGFRETGSLQFVNRVLVSNTTFTKNSATFGGGAFFLVLGESPLMYQHDRMNPLDVLVLLQTLCRDILISQSSFCTISGRNVTLKQGREL